MQNTSVTNQVKFLELEKQPPLWQMVAMSLFLFVWVSVVFYVVWQIFLRQEDKPVRQPAPSPTKTTPPPPPQPEPIEIPSISPDALKEALESEKAPVVVDLRMVWEYQSGHIPSAINIPTPQIPDRLAEIPKDRMVVMQCYHGFTSMDVVAYLLEQGWSEDKIANLDGGMSGWVSAHGMSALEMVDKEANPEENTSAEEDSSAS